MIKNIRINAKIHFISTLAIYFTDKLLNIRSNHYKYFSCYF